MPGHAPARAYGSEGWEFESLRARRNPWQGMCLSAWRLATRPKAEDFLILSVSTIAAGVFVQHGPHIGAAGLPL
jgi:hypothetical protein